MKIMNYQFFIPGLVLVVFCAVVVVLTKMNGKCLSRAFMTGIANILVGILCMVVAGYCFWASFRIYKFSTDAMMAEIDSKFVRNDLTPVEKLQYESAKTWIVSEYHSRVSAEEVTWSAGVLGMLIVGTYNIITGIILCRKKSTG